MKSSSEGSLINCFYPNRDSRSTSTCALCCLPKSRKSSCKSLKDPCSKKSAGVLPRIGLVWDDIDDLHGPGEGSFIKSPSGHRRLSKKTCDSKNCEDDSREESNTPPASSSCACSGQSTPSASTKAPSSSCPSQLSNRSPALPITSKGEPSPLYPEFMSAMPCCTDPGPSLKSPEVELECACDAALYNEFVYYCSALRLLIPSMTKPHSKENVVHWLAKLCEPGCVCTDTKENRNRYLFGLLVNVLNDESFGWYSRPPYESELTDVKQLVRFHIPKCAWESDTMWDDILGTMPQELISECRCGNTECKATPEISQQLDEEFRFYLHLARPFVEFMSSQEDSATMSEWIQYLCAISPKSCDSKKSNRNNFMMALYAYAASLSLSGPFQKPPDWNKPLPKLCEVMDDTNDFLESQPVPADGVLAFLTATADNPDASPANKT